MTDAEIERLLAEAPGVREVALDYIARAFNRHDRTTPRHTIPRREDDHDARLMDFLRAMPEPLAEVLRLRGLVTRLAERVVHDTTCDAGNCDPRLAPHRCECTCDLNALLAEARKATT